jgi:hypothetical protein
MCFCIFAPMQHFPPLFRRAGPPLPEIGKLLLIFRWRCCGGRQIGVVHDTIQPVATVVGPMHVFEHHQRVRPLQLIERCGEDVVAVC